MRIGLDLAVAPGCWDLLSFLPPGECAELLQAAGFSVAEWEILVDTGTADPLLVEWVRSSHPLALDEPGLAALAACWSAVLVDDPARLIEERAVRLRRSYLALVRRDMGLGSETIRESPGVAASAHLWQGYLLHGRRQLASLGERVVVSPPMAGGFGVADLVVGRCLVEIKTVLDPAARFGEWLDQLLGYVLLDWFDVLHLDMVGVYLAWQAVFVGTPIAAVLATASGSSFALEGLRADFRQQIQADVDRTHEAILRRRYS
ncbi:MAG: hypothetical protein ABJB47_02020 [Actinomycetota bacterium]